jgi:hypothetical protein
MGKGRVGCIKDGIGGEVNDRGKSNITYLKEGEIKRERAEEGSELY